MRRATPRLGAKAAPLETARCDWVTQRVHARCASSLLLVYKIILYKCKREQRAMGRLTGELLVNVDVVAVRNLLDTVKCGALDASMSPSRTMDVHMRGMARERRHIR